MKMIRNSILIFIFFPVFCFSQEDDFQVWSSFSVKQRISKKTDFCFRNTLRFRENVSLLSKAFIDLKIRYKYKKKLYFALGYRDINEWNIQLDREKKERYYADIYMRKKTGRFVFLLRNRIQRQGDIKAYDYIFRQKYIMNYNIRRSKLTPSVSTEFFYHYIDKINKLRHSLTFSYPLFKRLDFDISYRIQQELNKANPLSIYILDGKISYTL